MWVDLCAWYKRRYANFEPIVLLSTLALVGYLIIAQAQVVAPIVTSVIVAYLLQGPMRWLERVGLSHHVSLSLVFLVFLGCVLGLFLWLMPLLWQELLNVYRVLPEAVDKAQGLMTHLPEHAQALLDQVQWHNFATQAQTTFARMSQRILMYSLSSIPFLMQFVIYVILVPLMVVYFLGDSQKISSWLEGLLPKQHTMLNQVWSVYDAQLGHYVRGKMLEFVVMALISSIAFSVLGLKYPILMGVLLGFSAFVPVVGGFLVTIPLLVIGFWQWGWSASFGHLVLAHAALLFFDAYVLVPYIFSNRLGLHPLAIILAVLIFGELWGVWGVFFAIPLVALIKTVHDALREARVS